MRKLPHNCSVFFLHFFFYAFFLTLSQNSFHLQFNSISRIKLQLGDFLLQQYQLTDRLGGRHTDKHLFNYCVLKCFYNLKDLIHLTAEEKVFKFS